MDVRRAQQPDGSASWQGSWQRLSERVHGFLRGKFGGARLPYDVEFDDLFAAVLVRMLRDLPRLQVGDRAEFWAWVRRLASNQIVDFWRQHGRQSSGSANVEQVQGEEGDQWLDQVCDRAAHTGGALLRARELEDAEEACARTLLNERVRAIYLLRRREELPFAEIAARVGDANADITRVTFRRAKGRVLQCLRTKLDGYEGAATRF